MILLDASASMGYSSGGVSKLQYGKFLAAALAYLAARQHDPVGLIVFDEKVRQYRPATSRAGSLQSMIHTIDAVTAGGGTNLEELLPQLRRASEASRPGRSDLRSVLRPRGDEQGRAAARLSRSRHHAVPAARSARAEARLARVGAAGGRRDSQARSTSRRSISRASIASSWTRIWPRCVRRPPTSARISC